MGYASFMKHIYSQSKFSSSDIAKFRLEVITFYQRHGIAATREAFKVGRSTVFLWKKKLKDSNGSLLSLLPTSTKPKTLRKMVVNKKILEFIHNLREHNLRIGKDKIKILLDAYCHKERLPLVSSSKIGRIIKKNNWFFDKSGKLYHNPSHRWDRKKRKKSRLHSSFKSRKPGDLLQIDTLVRFDLNIKRYIVTAVDLYSRFSFAFSYKSLSSRISLDFYQKLILIAPFRMKAVKTDNGLEFLGEFDLYLKNKGVKHYFSYPRTPKSNAFIERFNRTIQEEFVNSHLEYIEDTQLFNTKLMDYLVYYNTVRPHQSLNYLTPMGFMLKEDLKSKKYWTSTFG